MQKQGQFVLLALLGLMVGLLWVKPVSAEPYIAIRTGYKCAQCHVNRSGGGKRTDFGVIYSQTHLYMKLLGAKNRPTFFSNRVSENVSIGANFRAENVSVFQYENVLTEDTDFNNDSRITEANMYFLFDVVPDVLSIYADQTLAPGSANREFFGILQNLPFNSYLKAGRMLLPYGLRLRDDEAFIRNESGFTYNKHDLGVEVGLEPGSHSLIANITQNQISFVGSVVFRRFRVGGSYAKNIIGMVDDHTYGGFAGANFGRFTLLGEIDLLQRAGIDRLASIAELDFLLMRGLNLKGIYEFFDRNRDISNSRDGQERFTLGVEAFVSQFVQMSLYYRFNRFIPQNARLNQDQLIAQFHVFF